MSASFNSLYYTLNFTQDNLIGLISSASCVSIFYCPCIIATAFPLPIVPALIVLVLIIPVLIILALIVPVLIAPALIVSVLIALALIFPVLIFLALIVPAFFRSRMCFNRFLTGSNRSFLNRL